MGGCWFCLVFSFVLLVGSLEGQTTVLPGFDTGDEKLMILMRLPPGFDAGDKILILMGHLESRTSIFQNLESYTWSATGLRRSILPDLN